MLRIYDKSKTTSNKLTLNLNKSNSINIKYPPHKSYDGLSLKKS